MKRLGSSDQEMTTLPGHQGRDMKTLGFSRLSPFVNVVNGLEFRETLEINRVLKKSYK